MLSPNTALPAEGEYAFMRRSDPDAASYKEAWGVESYAWVHPDAGELLMAWTSFRPVGQSMQDLGWIKGAGFVWCTRKSLKYLIVFWSENMET